MPSSKNFSRYATVWLNLFCNFRDEPTKVYRMVCENEKAAKALRIEFYKARDAFLSEPTTIEEFEETLYQKEVKVRDNVVIFDIKDNNWVAKIIQETLDKEEQNDQH